MVEQTDTTGFKTDMNSVYWVYLLVNALLPVCNASHACQIHSGIK